MVKNAKVKNKPKGYLVHTHTQVLLNVTGLETTEVITNKIPVENVYEATLELPKVMSRTTSLYAGGQYNGSNRYPRIVSSENQVEVMKQWLNSMFIEGVQNPTFVPRATVKASATKKDDIIDEFWYEAVLSEKSAEKNDGKE